MNPLRIRRSRAAAIAAFLLLVVVVNVLVTLSVCSISRADDWPRWRGPRGDGISEESGLLEQWPKSLRPVWTAEVGDGYSSPVAQGGRVYQFSLVGRKDTLTCYDAASGKVIWSKSYDGGWTGAYPGTRATPNIDGDRIYTYGGEGDLVARELATGKQLWRLNVLRETRARPLGWAQASNPLIDGDLIYVQNGAGGPVAVAVDKNSGKIVWRSQARGNGSYAHPVMADVQGTKQLIIYAAAGPLGMDPTNGKTIWHHRWQNGPEVNASDPIYRDGHLFVTSAYDKGAMMLQLSPNGAGKLWENRDIASRFQPAILDGDYLYVNSEGTLTCLKWPTSKVQWVMRNQDRNLLGMGGSMVRVGGDNLILLSQSGRLTLARATPQGFERISSVPDVVEGTQVWATPALHDGMLYLKGQKELVCIDVKAK
jgi:outer membrane protein assembly factor BamB